MTSLGNGLTAERDHNHVTLYKFGTLLKRANISKAVNRRLLIVELVNDSGARPSSVAHRASISSHISRILIFTMVLSVSLAVETAPAQECPEKGLGLLEAVRITLAKNPNIQLQKKQVEINRAGLQTARGQFNTKLGVSLTRARDYTPLLETAKPLYSEGKVITDQNAYEISLDKQFRSGLRIGPNISITRTTDNALSFPTRDNKAKVGFSIVQPLLRGRGKRVTAANELSAKIGYQASVLDLRHTASGSILNTVLAYWNYIATYKNLKILKESEERARILAEETQTLIEADERAAADLNPLLANLADKRAARIQAEQSLLEAKQNLGLTMGLPLDEIQSLPLPSDDFPGIEDVLPGESASENFIKEAINRRADLSAAKQRQKSAKIQLAAARSNLKPSLDLYLDVGYAGLGVGTETERYFTPFYEDVPGLNVSVHIGYQWPPRNAYYRGLLLRQGSLYQQSVIQTDNLARNIGSSVGVLLAGLCHSAIGLKSSEEAIDLYRLAVDSEKQKYRMEMSTLMDVTMIEDRLTSALLGKVSRQLSYATALVRLRYETGTLVSPEGEEISVGMEDLTTVPFR